MGQYSLRIIFNTYPSHAKRRQTLYAQCLPPDLLSERERFGTIVKYDIIATLYFMLNILTIVFTFDIMPNKILLNP